MKPKPARKQKTKQQPVRTRNKIDKAKPEEVHVENDAEAIKLDSSGRVTEGRFAGYYRLPHGMYSRTSPQEREQRERERRASEQAKQDRFRQACEQGKKHFSNKDIRTYWLKQLDKAASLPVCYWADSPIKWPRDKTIVYATTAICMQGYSHFEIIPESFKKTPQYEKNKHISIAFLHFDNLSLQDFLSYIEADLREQGLLESKKQGYGKKKQGRPGLSESERTKRKTILEKWSEKKEEMSRRQFCKAENISINYLKTCQDWSRPKRTN